MLQELLAQDTTQASSSFNEEVDLDELMDVRSFFSFLSMCLTGKLCLSLFFFFFLNFPYTYDNFGIVRILSWRNCTQTGLPLSRSDLYVSKHFDVVTFTASFSVMG